MVERFEGLGSTAAAAAMAVLALADGAHAQAVELDKQGSQLAPFIADEACLSVWSNLDNPYKQAVYLQVSGILMGRQFVGEPDSFNSNKTAKKVDTMVLEVLETWGYDTSDPEAAIRKMQENFDWQVDGVVGQQVTLGLTRAFTKIHDCLRDYQNAKNNKILLERLARAEAELAAVQRTLQQHPEISPGQSIPDQVLELTEQLTSAQEVADNLAYFVGALISKVRGLQLELKDRGDYRGPFRQTPPTRNPEVGVSYNPI